MIDEKIDRIVELDIDDEQLDDELFEDTGVDIVSLVDAPAIQTDFMYFSEEEFVEPTAGETEDEFISRCMSKLVTEFPDEEQRVAVCYSYWKGQQELCEGDCETHILSKEEQDTALQFAEDDNNGYYIGKYDLYIDMTLNQFAGIGDVITAIRSLDVLKRLSIKKEAAPETYWRYTGPKAQRDFCKAMLRLADRGKIFTTDEVNKMASLNRDFGPRGNSSYSKLEWKGGPNCVHYWTKLEVFKGDTGNKVIIASNRADNSKEQKAMKSNNQRQPSPQGHTPNNAYIKKRNFSFNLDEDKRLVTGPVMIPNKMILRRDEGGQPFYIYFTKKTIRKMAEKFFKLNKHNNTDINHDENITNDNTLIESWISESIKHDKSYKYGFALPEGTWYVTYKINDDETWERIKSGELRGFSLAGGFIQKMKPIDPERTLNEIKDILKQVK